MGLAFDCAFAGHDPYLVNKPVEDQQYKWATYGKIVTDNGLSWGGNFQLTNGARDLPHAEMTYGLRIEECLELYCSAGIEAVWTQLDKLRNVEVGLNWEF